MKNPSAVPPQQPGYVQGGLLWLTFALGFLAWIEAIAKLLHPSASWPFTAVFLTTVALALGISLAQQALWGRSSRPASKDRASSPTP